MAKIKYFIDKKKLPNTWRPNTKEMVQELQYGLKLIKEIINHQLRKVTSNSPSDTNI
jgi:hypothetical protein